MEYLKPPAALLEHRNTSGSNLKLHLTFVLVGHGHFGMASIIVFNVECDMLHKIAPTKIEGMPERSAFAHPSEL